MDDTDLDVLIVGAGPAGAVAARRLASFGARVLAIEQDLDGHARFGETLAPAVRSLLVELGCWDGFMGIGPLPSDGTVSAWGDDEPATHSRLMTPYGEGWHVDRREFDRLLRSLAMASGTAVESNRRLTDVRRSKTAWELDVAMADAPESGARTITASVIVDATGRSASVGRRLGAIRRRFDRLTAVGAHIQRRRPAERGVLVVESTPDGWWYRAPVSRESDAVVLLTDADLCGRHQLSRSTMWASAFESARLVADGAPSRIVWGPTRVSAGSHRLDRRFDDRPWLAVGDAALSVDPIAGSGVVTALRTGMAGADVALGLLDGRRGGTGGLAALHAYERSLDLKATTYLLERAGFYASEQRFSSPFWQRRVAAGSRVRGTDHRSLVDGS
jgi:flavin-dependent dehydrogenase